MLAILNSLNTHNLPIFQPILMILVSKLMVHRALSDKTYLSLGLLSPLRQILLYVGDGHENQREIILVLNTDNKWVTPMDWLEIKSSHYVKNS